MATNKNALIRYRTIDKCLQNRQRQWSLDDLITACSDALYEYEGKDCHVSKRTVQLDIQMMRSNKLGYNAPIIVYNKKYYTYEKPNFTITEIPLTDMDLDVLSESMEMLRQFKDFSLFSELNGIIQKLEDKIYRETNLQSPVIHLEKNENLKGLKYLDTLYQAIIKQLVLKISYKSFKARSDSEITFHPYILKEFNNRWFLVGRKNKENMILTLALDRIFKIDYELNIQYEQKDFDANTYYNNTYGVTVLGDKQIIDIVLKVDKENSPYILTKPLHHSQKFIEKTADGHSVFQIRVHHNFEIERLILGFGSSVEVLKPRRLRNRIRKKINEAYKIYNSEHALST